MNKGKQAYQNLVEAMREGYNNIAEHGYDIGDFGNAVGYALGEELKDEDMADTFAWGVEHGVSLIDGSHDNPSIRKWRFCVRDWNTSWWKFTLQKIKSRIGIYD